MIEFAFVCTCVIIFRGFWNLRILNNNISWLNDSSNKITPEYENPFVYVIIPILREQSVISETIKHFLSIDYPKKKIQIVLVTTEKENIDKQQNRTKIRTLATDIYNGLSIEKVQNKYLGLFPSVAFEKIKSSFYGKFEDKQELISELEIFYDSYPTTMDVVKELQFEVNTPNPGFIKIIHYPNNNKIVTDQINFASKLISQSTNSSTDLIAIYNADSRPNIDTFVSVSDARDEYNKIYNKEPNIIQQSSLFTLNYSKLPNTISGYILKAGCINQSIWTLANEIFLLRNQSYLVNKRSSNLIELFKNTEPAYCIAHGMFANLQYFNSRGGFPTETLNEDLPFGFFTCARGDSILPIKKLENSESPETIKSLINQKKVWFNPYLEFLKCRKNALIKKQYRNINELNILTLKSLNVGSIWLFQTILFTFPLIYLAFKFDTYLALLWLLAITTFWYLPAFIVYFAKYLNQNNIYYKPNWKDFILMILAGHFNVIFNSIGPILCIIEFTKSKLFGISITKQKTER